MKENETKGLQISRIMNQYNKLQIRNQFLEEKIQQLTEKHNFLNGKFSKTSCSLLNEKTKSNGKKN